MQIKALLNQAVQELHSHVESSRLDAEILLARVLQTTRLKIITHLDQYISNAAEQQFLTLIHRRKLGEPIAYLIGEKEFWSLPFRVTPDTLIPRPETELLVELILQLDLADTDIKLADLGTGSGAIALAIASERPHWNIIATDYSEAALNIAKQNADNLAIRNVEFRCGNWCEALSNERFNIIVSNPPYIRENDEHLSHEGVKYEPKTALTAGEMGLNDLTKIIQQAPNHLIAGGLLCLEHGYDQAEDVYTLLDKAGYKQIQSHQDYSGILRVTSAFF